MNNQGAIAKNHRCPVCNKAFATKASLKQHRGAAHQGNVQRSRQAATIASRRAPVSLPTSVPSSGGSSVRLQGSELLLNFRVNSTIPAPVDVLVSASCVPRLAHLSAAFQRIQFHSVAMVVTPQGSAMVNGGYVAAFVADPTDHVTDPVRLQSQQGAVVKKWWESASVRLHTNTGAKFYTSLKDEDLRWYSPGKFQLLVNGVPSTEVDVNVSLSWDVTLSGPSLETETPAVKKVLIVEESLWGVKNNYALGDKGGNMDRAASMVPGLPSKDRYEGRFYYRVPTYVIEYSEGTGDTGTRQHQFVCYDTKDGRLYFSDEPGSAPERTKWQSDLAPQIVVPKTTEMILVEAGNALPAPNKLQLFASKRSSGALCTLDSTELSTSSNIAENSSNPSETLSEIQSVILRLASRIAKIESETKRENSA